MSHEDRDDVLDPRPPPRRRAERIVYAPATAETRAAIRSMYDRGVKIPTLARHFSVSWQTARGIVGEAP